jgi:hypothetical protein
MATTNQNHLLITAVKEFGEWSLSVKAPSKKVKPSILVLLIE